MNPSRGSQEAPLTGEVRVPGDKSISHRAILLAALARGPSRIGGLNLGDDVKATCRAVAALGAPCRLDELKATAEVEGCGWEGLREPDDVVDAGNSGTTLRTLLGVCAGIPGSYVLTGDDSLRRRPMLRVVGPLRRMGARIDGRRSGDLAPLWVRGGDLSGTELDLEVASAQVKTALLLAALRARGSTTVRMPAPSRDHTERMLAAAGAHLRCSERTIALQGGQSLEPGDRVVPGDVSSALFLVVAALVVPGSELSIRQVGTNPTRTGALDVLARMGGDLEVEPGRDEGGEPEGTIRVRASELTGAEIGPEGVPLLIDEIPVLAVAATQAHGETVVRGAGELRVKESDRIEALVEGLATLGADVEARPDGLAIGGPTQLRGGEVDSRADHRIALSFAVAGLVASGPVRVRGWDCVDTSFPEFLSVLAEARGRR